MLPLSWYDEDQVAPAKDIDKDLAKALRQARERPRDFALRCDGAALLKLW